MVPTPAQRRAMIYDLTSPTYWNMPWVLGAPPAWVLARWESRRGAAREASWDHLD